MAESNAWQLRVPAQALASGQLLASGGVVTAVQALASEEEGCE